MITLTITDAQDTMTFNVIAEPLVFSNLLKETDIETVDNNISTYFSGEIKRNFSVQLGDLDNGIYHRLVDFVKRQRFNRKYALVTLDGAANIITNLMPAKMTISDERIVNNCALVESVELTFRESKQMQ